MIPEPAEGAQADPAETARRLKSAIIAELDRLSAIPLDALVEQRYRRYRALGAFSELEGPEPTPPIPPRPGLAERLRGLLEAGQRAIPAPLPVGRRDEPPAREDVCRMPDPRPHRRPNARPATGRPREPRPPLGVARAGAGPEALGERPR